jgi:hypothetical protein
VGEYTDLKRQLVLAPGRPRFRIVALCLAALIVVLAGCGGPNLTNPNDSTLAPTPSATIVVPTAAVGRTTGAPCESGTLRVKDLAAIESRWRDGLSVAKGRAAAWQPDAVLIEFGISCELFEAGFRWQATFFSRNAQAFYRADTTEVIPVNTDPEAIIPLPESEIDFDALAKVISDYDDVPVDAEDTITALDVRVSTEMQPIGPPGVPTGAAIYHLALRTRGLILELYVDPIDEKIYRFE